MSLYLVAGGLVFLILEGTALFFIGKRYGKNSARRDYAEAQAKDRAQDAAIAAKPSIDDPTSAMRRLSQ